MSGVGNGWYSVVVVVDVVVVDVDVDVVVVVVVVFKWTSLEKVSDQDIKHKEIKLSCLLVG